jgi:hypothetical protein
LSPDVEVVTAYEMHEVGTSTSSVVMNNDDGTYTHIGGNGKQTIIDTNKSLNDLLDVNAPAPKQGQVISWINGKWQPVENIPKRSDKTWTNVRGQDEFEFTHVTQTLDVYLNGSKLVEILEYTSDGNVISLKEPITSNSDVLYAVTIGVDSFLNYSVDSKVYTKNEVDDAIEKKVDSLYPVGMVWLSIAGQNPNDTLPGNWTMLKEGQFSSDNDKMPVNMWQRTK